MIYDKILFQMKLAIKPLMRWCTAQTKTGSLRGVVVNVLDCDIFVNGFELHFRTNTFRKGMNPFILPAMG